MMKVSAFLLLKITEGCHHRVAGALLLHTTQALGAVCLVTGHLVSFIPISLAAGIPLQGAAPSMRR